MSDYVIQHNCDCSFDNSDSWTVLSPIERSIKEKIERIGKPLKEWDISINYGIKTGFNDAFIISGEKRRELINEDPKSEEIIRPILRGRDIKRYGYEFADLYLIATFPAKHYDINNFPAIKKHLLSFDIRRLEQSGKKSIDGIKGNDARKKTNNLWFETQDSINYWEDFSKQKLVYREIGTAMDACILPENYYINNKLYMITGEKLGYLLAFFNSKIFKLILKSTNITGGKGADFLSKVRLIYPSYNQSEEIKRFSTNNVLDNQINRFFYNLFDLTMSEIQTLERY